MIVILREPCLGKLSRLKLLQVIKSTGSLRPQVPQEFSLIDSPFLQYHQHEVGAHEKNKLWCRKPDSDEILPPYCSLVTCDSFQCLKEHMLERQRQVRTKANRCNNSRRVERLPYE